jgi:hypothetical protein
LPIGPVIVEEIELDEFEALVFEIKKGSCNAVSSHNLVQQENAGQRRGIARTPIVLPVHPGSIAELEPTHAAMAQSVVLRHFALEAAIATSRDFVEALQGSV